MFCVACGTRHTGKGSPAAAEPCPKNLHDKSTQGYLTKVLRQGKQPAQLAKAFAGQWPDGVSATATPQRPVYRCHWDVEAWCLTYDGST